MENLDYETFAEKCVAELKPLQDQFIDRYDLNWYESWFYNQATGLLTFSTGDQQINFKYFEVGTFSEKSKTWKWAWDNKSILDKIKERSNRVKEFGEQTDYSKLTIGYFPSDEIEAWEFTAIAWKLENGIGVYRPVSDEGLQSYIVITEFIEKETAQKIKDRFVECGDHDYGRIAFVCKHLNHQSKVGFQEAFETFENMELGDDDDFQAWCDECEKVRQTEGEWNEKSMTFAQIRTVCEKCYFEMKAINGK